MKHVHYFVIVLNVGKKKLKDKLRHADIPHIHTPLYSIEQYVLYSFITYTDIFVLQDRFLHNCIILR